MLNALLHQSHHPELSAEFRRALTREIMRTERQRIVVLMATLLLILVFTVGATLLVPQQLERLFHGQFKPWIPFAVVLPVLAFECVALLAIRWRLKTGRDIPVVARYLSALVETSLPSFVLMAQTPMMGSTAALGFIGPMMYFLFIILSTMRLDFWLSVFTGLVAGTELFAISYFSAPPPADPDSPLLSPLFLLSRCVVPLIAGVLAGTVGLRLRRQFEASIAAASARDQITNLFGQHVSPQVVERLLAAGAEMAGDTHSVAVMFVDIRGFTAAARQRSPRQVVERLDAAFAVLVEIVDRNGGIVNKFLGDGFLALFGAPLEDAQASQRAVAAAREMLIAMERENTNSDWPLRIGIGLHIGDVVAGNIGSPRRKEYTVIGDTVNLAARIEALNKEFGSQLLVSDAVHRSMPDQLADAEPLGEVPIRGYDTPLAMWRLA